jgi:uncharacterized membrane protein YbhN (UPF0104 family)
VRKWFTVLLSLAVLGVLVKMAGLREVLHTWTIIRPEGVVLSIGCYYASIAVRILSWKLLLGNRAKNAGRLARPLALGFVLGHVTPAKAGEPATALLVSRTSEIPLATTLSVLTAERTFHFLLLLATFLPAFAVGIGHAPPAVWGGGAALAGVLLAIGPAASRLSAPAGRIPRFGPAVARYLEALGALLLRRRILPAMVALALCFWLLQYLSLYAILRAGGAEVSFAGAAAVAGSSILGGTLSMLPLGTQDGISALVLSRMSVPMAQGFSLALFHTALSLGCGLLLLLFAGTGVRRK